VLMAAGQPVSRRRRRHSSRFVFSSRFFAVHRLDGDFLRGGRHFVLDSREPLRLGSQGVPRLWLELQDGAFFGLLLLA
jgi:hypothetical protein